MTLEEIQRAIADLVPAEVAEFRLWFERFDAIKKTGRLEYSEAARESARRLARLGGSEPDLEMPRRR